MRYLMEQTHPSPDDPAIYFHPHHVQLFHPDGDVQLLGTLAAARLYADTYRTSYVKAGEENQREKHITTDPDTILTVELEWLTGTTKSFNVSRATIVDGGKYDYVLTVETENNWDTKHHLGLPFG